MSAIHFSAHTPARPIRSIQEVTALLAPTQQNSDFIGVEAEAFLIHEYHAHPATQEDYANILSRYKAITGFTDFLTEQKPDGRKVIVGLTGGTALHTGADITTEPGFQIEYGGAPQSDLHKIACTLDNHLHKLTQAAQDYNHRVALSGLHPLFAGADLPLIDKERYALMTSHAQLGWGDDGLTAMRGTTGIQYNLDTSPDNWARRYRAAYAIQPFINLKTAVDEASAFKIEGESTDFRDLEAASGSGQAGRRVQMSSL